MLGAAGDGRLLVAKSDPITFATDRIGWYTVHVNANDLACLGATPRWLLATALLPEQWEEADVRGLFDDLGTTCTALGITLVGGHTEITGGLDRPHCVGLPARRSEPRAAGAPRRRPAGRYESCSRAV